MAKYSRICCWMILLMTGVVSMAAGQIYKLPHPDTTRGNFFGVSVSISGNRAIVGASGEDNCGINSGAAYIYERDSTAGTWGQVARLVASDCAEGRFFGRTLALSGDRAIVAAVRPFFSTYTSNTAYVFDRLPDTGEWVEVAKLNADGKQDEGAFAVSVSLDGDRALVTTSGDISRARFGGAAYIFEYDADKGWHRAGRFTGSGRLSTGIFGTAADLDGDRAVVAASTYFAEKPGSIYIFERNPVSNEWEEKAHFGDVRDFYITVELNGDRILAGESKGARKASGRVSVYQRTEQGAWTKAGYILPKTPYDHGAFGSEIALFGDHALVAGYDEQLSLEFNIDRVVYLFQYQKDTGDWVQTRVYDVGAVAFGTSISTDQGRALVGEASEQRFGQAFVLDLPSEK